MDSEPNEVKISNNGEYMRGLMDRGPLDLDILLGGDWRERAVSNNIVISLEKRLKAKVNSIDVFANEDLGSDDANSLANRLVSEGSRVEIVRTVDNENKGTDYLLTHRSVLDGKGDEVCEVHELIDPREVICFDQVLENGNSVWGFDTVTVLLSCGNNYVDLKSLTIDDSLELGFMNTTSKKSTSKKNFSNDIAHRDKTFVGMGGIETLDSLYTLSHELGHIFYGLNDEKWDEVQGQARYIYRQEIEEEKGMTNYQARGLVSINERFAWDAGSQLITWLQYEFGANIPLEEKLKLYSEEEESLLTYDTIPYAGQGVNPPTFSRTMQFFREYYLMCEEKKKFNIFTGENISNCPLIQVAMEENMTFEKYLDLLKQAGTINESQIKSTLSELLQET